MRVISIDVGIKNLAYCILEGSDCKLIPDYKLIQWDVINLCGADTLCNCTLKPKVIKGKKMPGHMGVEQRVSENLEILKIEKDQNIVVVKGSVPGKAGSLVFVCNRVNA